MVAGFFIQGCNQSHHVAQEAVDVKPVTPSEAPDSEAPDPFPTVDLSTSTALTANTNVFASTTRKLIFSVNYETGKPNSGVPNILVYPAQNPDSITMISPGRSGRYAVKTKVGATKDYVTEGSPRAETASINISESLYSPGEKWEYKFSLKLESGWAIDPSGNGEIVWQFKRFSSGPDMAVTVKRNLIVLRTTSVNQNTLVDLSRIPAGQWLDFKINVLWSTGSNGITEVWFKKASDANYTIVASNSGPNMYNDAQKGAYLKWGIYRPGCKPEGGSYCNSSPYSTRVVYHDDISVTRLSN